MFALLDKRDSNSFLVANFEKDADPQSNTTKTMLLTKNYHSKDDEIFIIEKTMLAGIVERD
ncbi:MAG: ParA family protein, partial [Enterococcus faecalis]|nr:ParA family protein [Enterococcus faecalis]